MFTRLGVTQVCSNVILFSACLNAGPLNQSRGNFIPTTQQKQQKLHHQGQHTAQPPLAKKNVTVAPVFTPGQKPVCSSLLSSKKNRNPSPSTAVKNSPTSPPPPPPPPDNCTKDGPDYDEPDLTAVELSPVEYYASKDLVGERRDLQAVQTTGEYILPLFLCVIIFCVV